MTQPVGYRNWNLPATVCLFIVTLLCGVPVGFAAESTAPPSSAQEQKNQPAEAGDIQDRGLKNARPGRALGETKHLPPPPQPGGGLPPNLCHQVTHMMTQCKCFNQGECQALSALFPNSCPPGSAHCEFVPMSRGAMPPLPPNLCGYQVPWTTTECSCHNATECQQLTPICPGSCPAGSQSCTCRPMQRRTTGP